MQKILINNLNLGGIADSKYQGAANSVAELVGFDIHSEPGILKHNQQLYTESNSTGIGIVDDLIKKILTCSDGNVYLFGSTTGKIWKRTPGATYSLEATVSPAAGAVGIMDAWEKSGYIYYTMQSRVGRVAVGAPTDWSTRNDSWATFTNTDADFHPMQEVNGVIYIGDKNYLAQIDGGVFSANALDVEAPLRIKTLCKYATDVLIGTFFNLYRTIIQVFQWNTWSQSFNSSDDIPEVGINSFLKTDNFVLVNAGTKGNFYYYTGSALENFKQIPGDFSGSNEAYVHPNASCNRNGLPLFGLSNVYGNPAKQGIYSLGGHDRNYPKVLNLENTLYNGCTANVDIGAIELSGPTLLVSWKVSSYVSISIADPCIVTWTDHGFINNGHPVMFTTNGALPTGISASTYYYMRIIDANTFHLYDTFAHAISTGSTTGRIITSGTQSGGQICASYGVDSPNIAAKNRQAYFVLREINQDRDKNKLLEGYMAYRSKPGNSTIKIYYKVNNESTWNEATTVVDTVRKIVSCKQRLPPATSISIKVESNASTSSVNEAPELELAEFNFN